MVGILYNVKFGKFNKTTISRTNGGHICFMIPWLKQVDKIEFGNCVAPKRFAYRDKQIICTQCLHRANQKTLESIHYICLLKSTILNSTQQFYLAQIVNYLPWVYNYCTFHVGFKFLTMGLSSLQMITKMGVGRIVHIMYKIWSWGGLIITVQISKYCVTHCNIIKLQ